MKWTALVEEIDILELDNAYKDIEVYSDTGKVIGHIRQDDEMKTGESYRTVPLNPRLKARLLRHKKRQQKLFEELGIVWTEEQYMFLNRNRKPFVSENLSKNMTNFRKKYNLEYMTVYGLRHSFATFCSENGMDPLVLMKIMGHTKFETTQKYYIGISQKRKYKEMNKVYGDFMQNKNNISIAV